jgi:hypothetical protein
MREQLADFHDSTMTAHATDGSGRIDGVIQER